MIVARGSLAEHGLEADQVEHVFFGDERLHAPPHHLLGAPLGELQKCRVRDLDAPVGGGHEHAVGQLVDDDGKGRTVRGAIVAPGDLESFGELHCRLLPLTLENGGAYRPARC